MPSKEQTHDNRTSSKQWSAKSALGNLDTLAQQQPHLAPVVQRAGRDLGSLTPHNVLQLQRTIGNHAVARLLSKVRLHPVIQARPGPGVGPAHGANGQTAEQPPNQTGLPDTLKAGVENLSGYSLDNVRVHYNSPKPAQIQSLGYTKGSDIYIAPGQEQHLPHETWHVVQQAQGRVPATARLGKQNANLDAGLEAEAEQMGMSAMQQPPTATDIPLRPAAPSANAPLQGVFKYRGRVVVTSDPHQMERNWWVDEETHDVYVWLRDGQVDKSTNLPFVVLMRFRDGRIINARMLNQQGDLEPIENEEERAERASATGWEKPQEVRPTFVETSGSPLEVSMEDEPPMKAEVHQPDQPTYRQQFESDERFRDFRNARLESPFTVHPYLVPLAQGNPIMGTGGPTDFTYAAKDIGIAGMQVGDKDRPDTYLEPARGKSNIPQGRHTVAWALVRRSFMAMTGRTLAFVLDHMKAAFEHLIPRIVSPEAKALMQGTQVIQLIDAMLNAPLKMEAWNHLIGPLFNFYAVVYHQTEGALFAGRSVTRGESDAASAFGAAESNLQQGRPIGVDKGDLVRYAANLLDVNFTVSPHQYAFAVHHWIETLSQTYPLVMRDHGSAIVEPQLNKSITAKAYKGLTYPDPSDAAKQLSVTKVEHLLLACGYPSPRYATLTAPANYTPQQVITDFPFVNLKSAFTANVSLQKLREGVPVNYPSVLGPPQPAIQVSDYAMTELQVADIALSDEDRPKTKGGRVQFSHIVPWTLLRNAIMAFSGKPLTDLMNFLTEEFNLLKNDVPATHNEARQIVEHAQAGLNHLKGNRFTDYDWQNAVSLLVKLYAHVYQISKSAVFPDERTLGIAEGHAEGAHMKTLRDNETSLNANGTLVNPVERITQATTALYDAYIPAGRDAEPFARAFRHWEKLLTLAFPHVMGLLRREILAALGNKNVGTKSVPVLLKNALKPCGIVTE